VSALSRHEAKGVVFEEYRELGFNYRMSDLQAAVGVEQLKKLDGLLARRRAIAARYNAAFGSRREAAIPAMPPFAGHAYQSYGLCLTPAYGGRRDDLLRELIELGISCRRGIPPIHLEPLYASRLGPISLPVTETVSARSIFLPMFASLADADQDRIINAVTSLLTR
jgi:perosamine synthetase